MFLVALHWPPRLGDQHTGPTLRLVTAVLASSTAVFHILRRFDRTFGSGYADGHFGEKNTMHDW